MKRRPRLGPALLALAAVTVLNFAVPVDATPIRFRVDKLDTTYPILGHLGDGDVEAIAMPVMMEAAKSAAFYDVFRSIDPCLLGVPCLQTFDFRFDTLTGTVLNSPPPIRSSDGKTFDAFADVLFPTDPISPGDPIRLHVPGATLQPIQFTVVDPESGAPSSSSRAVGRGARAVAQSC